MAEWKEFHAGAGVRVMYSVVRGHSVNRPES